MKQPEALRLSEILEGGSDQFKKEAATELRRLLSESLRIEALHAQAQRELFDAKALNQELLEALTSIAKNTCCDRCQEAALVARAAITKGEQQ